jgi:hypothetical protein
MQRQRQQQQQHPAGVPAVGTRPPANLHVLHPAANLSRHRRLARKRWVPPLAV